MFKRETDRAWLKEKLQRLVSLYSFDDAGRAISRIEAKLYRIRVFGRHEFNEIRHALGPFETDETIVSEKNNKTYNIKVIKGIEGFPAFSLTFFKSYKKNPFHPSSIEIHPRADISLETYKAFLVWLNNKLPNLGLSKVEYVIDQYCKDSMGASLLFKIERRCLHLSSRRRGNSSGYSNLQNGRTKSLIHKIGRYHRVYERGPNSKKNGNSWSLEDVDRVRLVHTIKKIKLKKYGIQTLNDLIESPRFCVMNIDRWRFRQFLKSRTSPKYWQFHSKKSLENNAANSKEGTSDLATETEKMHQYLTNFKELVRIERRINRAMKIFDLEWFDLPR